MTDVRTAGATLGDVEISEIGVLLADRSRCRVLMALDDGRSLSASVLADEAGISRSTASGHLAKLTEAGLLTVDIQGRHRYYRLAGPHVGELLEKLTQIAPPAPVRSLREGTRAAQMRAARTCYDHLAGRLGVLVMGHLVEHRYVVGGTGRYDPATAVADRVRGYGSDVQYSVTPEGWSFLDELGVRVAQGSRTLVRYCVDWSEQQHHLAGTVGRAVLDRFLAASWIERRQVGRSVRVTPPGRDALDRHFGITWDGAHTGSTTEVRR